MSKEVIYAGDIVNAKSIVGLLDGTEMFCIPSPYYTVEGIKRPDLSTYLTIQSKSKFGAYMSMIYVHARLVPTRPFTSRFVIPWSKARGEKKSYYILKLYDTNTINQKFKHKLIITPNPIEKEDDKLAILDYQLCMLMDVLLLSKILNINIGSKNYQKQYDNTKFFTQFVKDMTTAINKLISDPESKVTVEQLMPTQEYIDTFNDPPIFMTRDKNVFPIAQLGKPKSKISSVWDKFYDLYSNTDLSYKLEAWKSIISAFTCAKPTIRYKDIIKKGTNEHIKRFDSKITFCQQLSENDPGYNPKIKSTIVTQRCIAKKTYESITPSNFPTIWGSSASDPNETKSTRQSGCIFLVPALEFKFYKQTNPTIEWRAEQVVLNQDVGKNIATYDDADAFIDEMDGDEKITDENEGVHQFHENDDDIPL